VSLFAAVLCVGFGYEPVLFSARRPVTLSWLAAVLATVIAGAAGYSWANDDSPRAR